MKVEWFIFALDIVKGGQKHQLYLALWTLGIIIKVSIYFLMQQLPRVPLFISFEITYEGWLRFRFIKHLTLRLYCSQTRGKTDTDSLCLLNDDNRPRYMYMYIHWSCIFYHSLFSMRFPFFSFFIQITSFLDLNLDLWKMECFIDDVRVSRLSREYMKWSGCPREMRERAPILK